MATNDKNPKEPQITARLEVIEDDARSAEPLPLTPAEIAALEAEKAQLVRELRASAPPPHRMAGDEMPVPEVPITFTPTPEYDAALADIDAADAELRQIEDDERKLEAARAEARTQDEKAHAARRAAMQQKRNDAQAKVDHLERIAAGIRLQTLTDQTMTEVAREQIRQNATAAQKAKELEQRVRPILDAAQRVLSVLASLWKENERSLKMLGTLTYKSAPSTWPGELRIRFEQQIAIPADKVYHEFAAMLKGLQDNVTSAQRLIAGKRWERGIDDTVTTLLRDLGFATDFERHWRNQILTLQGKLNEIMETGGLNQQDIPDEIFAVPADQVAAIKSELLHGTRSIYHTNDVANQTHAEGMGIPGASRGGRM
jgi:hypothetical protein